ncbi:pilus assembly protein FimV [Shewanella sp. C32]|uniref:Pilus assembly protein FimV n=1 Tax=Shewanella electrica TaxID=515560 RepID=A0ABT2FKN9_9GAMM|nr:FimV/HubP family polar landmark protein [Shewanella electrica]MCH1923685.1 pilus assembly protein FimV [Shewanella electrica]MCS4556904.1 pilus assembly protein FimV [Shewanella electrica]
MNFRTSYLVGLAAIFSAVAVPLFVPQAQSEVLKVTGPNGETRQQVRQYGPTSVNDTFWSIAQKVRPDDSISIYQVMAAIFEANPQAFTSDNYNSLERGMILLIPSKEVMAAIPVNLARSRAEQDDRNWNSKAVTTAAAKPVPKLTPEVSTPAPKATPPTQAAKPAPKAAESAVVNAANAELEALRQENGQLKQQLADLQQSLASSESQREALQLQNKSLDERFAQIDAELADTKLQLARLKEELAAQAADAEQKAAAAQAETQAPAVEMPSDTWRNLLDNPLLLGAITGGPALLLLLLLWFFLHRKRAAADAAAKNEPMDGAGAAAPLSGLNSDLDADESAIHLDDEQHDSLDSLLDVDNIDLQPEIELEHEDEQMAMAQEMFVDSGASDDAELLAADEGQSLDDLWAEAMGEQEPAPQQKAAAKDDFDSLLDGVDNEPSLQASLPDDVAAVLEQDFGSDDATDELLAELDEELGTSDTDLDADALLAELEGDFGASRQPEKASDQIIDADELLAALEGDLEDSDEPASSVSEHTLDADELLAEFAEAAPAEREDVTADIANDDAQAPAVTAQATSAEETALDEDLSAAIAAELEQDDDGELALDPDALLAELQAEPEPEDLSEAIAAELEDETLAESADELDPEALLAELEAEPQPEDLSEEIAAELEEDVLTEPALVEELDPDALIAELEAPEDLSDEIAAELADETSADLADDDFLDADALLAELEGDDATLSLDDDLSADAGDAPSEYDEMDADALLAELQQDSPLAVAPDDAADDEQTFDFSLEDELSVDDDENLDNLLAELSQEEEKKAKSSKDSGFFDDLKAARKADADADLTSLSDDELLKQFAIDAPDTDDGDVSFELTLDDDEPEDTPRLTVDEALAALDSQEIAKRPIRPVSDIDLAAFQKENGFIDIERLLNDAQESESESDPYQSRDVDVGDIDSLMGDTAMVDVDDEENSVNAKLDLARAYIEIDDSDSAKVLLQEVQADGNARQQEEAAHLLKDIS